MKYKAVIFDRDGTLLNERGYLGDPKKIKFYPWAFSAIKKLNKAGFRVVIVSNQSGVARGYFQLADMRRVNARFLSIMKKHGGKIHGTYFCPHSPTAGCRCRKPNTGLARRAAKDLKLDLKKSFVVGDQVRDMQLAVNISSQPVLVLTGAGRASRRKLKIKNLKVASNAMHAAKWILKQTA